MSRLFLDAIQPPEIELSLAGLREAEHQAGEVDRQWTLRLERAGYEAQLAERRYKAIDPDHRVVARTLEREWNEKLVELEQVEREYHEVRRRETLDLSEEDRTRILALARDLPAVWHAATTTHTERKHLLRLVVREVAVSPIEVPARLTRVQVLWQTGAVSDGADVAPFRPIAEDAGISQVVRGRWPTVFVADDVVDLAAEERVFFVDQAVLAQVVGSRCDQLTQRSAEVPTSRQDGRVRVPWRAASGVPVRDSGRARLSRRETSPPISHGR